MNGEREVENIWKPVSEDVYSFDTECIEDDDAYKEVLERLVAITKGKILINYFILEVRMKILKNNKLILSIAVIIMAILAIGLLVKKYFFKSIDNELVKYKFLKQENISSIPDEELVYAATGWMQGKFNSDWSNDFEVISSLPKPCQDIYSVYTIEAEVNNGGFNQCYFNSSNQFTTMAETGFKAIGAKGFADIMVRANLTYMENKDDLEKYDDGTLESFSESYEDNPLEALDDEFYDMYEKESLEQLCIDYIRANSQCFGD